MLPMRRNCPICHVETHGGRTCRYHVRQRDRHARAVRDIRVNHWKELLCEYIDEARRSTKK